MHGSTERIALCLILLLLLVAISVSANGAASNASALFATSSLHIFFYAWYGAPPHDVGFLHWTHSVLPHWTEAVTSRHRKEPYVAPGDPGVTFHPHRGLYSSHDSAVLDVQMAEIKAMLVDVVVVSWWGSKHKNTSMDGQGVGSDHCVPAILDAAAKHDLKVAFHLEPYPLRSQYSVKDDLVYIHEQYGNHSAFYRHPGTNQCLVYAYDSYHITVEQWQQLLLPPSSSSSLSIRGTSHDCIFLGLVLDDLTYLAKAGFQGAYSYFAANEFTSAASTSMWQHFSQKAAELNLLFIPSVAPGYDDTRLRPWNTANRKPREHGAYYDGMWRAALALPTPVLTITSYNEWGEGTQIEPARPFRTSAGELLRGYGEGDSDEPDGAELLYVNMTRRWARKWKMRWSQQQRRDAAHQQDVHSDLR